jgi:hypothetical protein
MNDKQPRITKSLFPTTATIKKPKHRFSLHDQPRDSKNIWLVARNGIVSMAGPSTDVAIALGWR